MIKGGLIFVAGVGVGYSVAMRSQEPNGRVKEATVEFLRTVKGIIADAHLDAKNEAKAAEESTPYCAYCGAPEEADGHGKSHADDCPTLKKNKDNEATEPLEAEPEGETPS